MIDPRTRLVLLLCAGILAISLEGAAALGLFTLLCALPLLFVGLDRWWLGRGLVAVVTIVWSTTLSQALFYAEQPRVSLGHLGPLHVWREGVTYGLAQSLRFVGLTLAGIALAVSTAPDHLHQALRRLRVPFGIALMASAALRFLPQLTTELATVRRARAMRGRPAWRRGPWARLLLEIGLLRPVVARSWRRAHNLAESLDARGFDPLAPRTERRPLRLGALDRLTLAAALTVTGAVVGGRLLYVLYTTESWFHPALRPLYGFTRAWL